MEDWIEINNNKSNIPNENGDYFVYTGIGGHKGIHIVGVNLNEIYGLNFIRNHGIRYIKVKYPKWPN